LLRSRCELVHSTGRKSWNAALMKVEATWHQGEVEALPVPDAKFDDAAAFARLDPGRDLR
jgi:hypothetical protein